MCTNFQKFLISQDVSFQEEALLQTKCERCKDDSHIWRGDSFDEELNVGYSLQMKLCAPSSQNEHKALSTERGTSTSTGPD